MLLLRRYRARHLLPVVPLLAVALFLLLPLAGEAAEGCDLYASPAGSDAAPGTAAEPLASPQALADSLAPGETGCFRDGLYDSFGQDVEVTTPGIALTSAPGERATIVGRWWIVRGADRVTVSSLDLDGRNARGRPGPVVNAAGTRFDDVDVTNRHTSICFVLGSAEYGAAVGTVIENSRIHDCGALPASNHEHGIYVEESRGVVIRDNWIYDNADRGIQLYPHAVGTHVYGNVIDGNGQGVIFSGAGDEASSENVVERNVISNSRVRWNAEAYWGERVGSGNVLRENCVWGGNEDGYYNRDGGVQPEEQGGTGFVARGNVVAAPRFVDRAGEDFTLEPGSPCAFARQGDSGAGGVTLRRHQSVVRANAPLRLSGSTAADVAGVVTIERRKGGSWRPFARRRLRADGTFVVRKRLPGARGAVRLRAIVPAVGTSPPVLIRVRRSGPAVRRAAISQRARAAS